MRIIPFLRECTDNSVFCGKMRTTPFSAGRCCLIRFLREGADYSVFCGKVRITPVLCGKVRITPQSCFKMLSSKKCLPLNSLSCYWPRGHPVLFERNLKCGLGHTNSIKTTDLLEPTQTISSLNLCHNRGNWVGLAGFDPFLLLESEHNKAIKISEPFSFNGAHLN